jgi:hypothetical protein
MPAIFFRGDIDPCDNDDAVGDVSTGRNHLGHDISTFDGGVDLGHVDYWLLGLL